MRDVHSRRVCEKHFYHCGLHLKPGRLVYWPHVYDLSLTDGPLDHLQEVDLIQ
jgi:hypothetical protein